MVVGVELAVLIGGVWTAAVAVDVDAGKTIAMLTVGMLDPTTGAVLLWLLSSHEDVGRVSDKWARPELWVDKFFRFELFMPLGKEERVC